MGALHDTSKDIVLSEEEIEFLKWYRSLGNVEQIAIRSWLYNRDDRLLRFVIFRVAASLLPFRKRFRR